MDDPSSEWELRTVSNLAAESSSEKLKQSRDTPCDTNPWTDAPWIPSCVQKPVNKWIDSLADKMKDAKPKIKNRLNLKKAFTVHTPKYHKITHSDDRKTDVVHENFSDDDAQEGQDDERCPWNCGGTTPLITPRDPRTRSSTKWRNQNGLTQDLIIPELLFGKNQHGSVNMISRGNDIDLSEYKPTFDIKISMEAAFGTDLMSYRTQGRALLNGVEAKNFREHVNLHHDMQTDYLLIQPDVFSRRQHVEILRITANTVQDFPYLSGMTDHPMPLTS